MLTLIKAPIAANCTAHITPAPSIRSMFPMARKGQVWILTGTVAGTWALASNVSRLSDNDREAEMQIAEDAAWTEQDRLSLWTAPAPKLATVDADEFERQRLIDMTQGIERESYHAPTTKYFTTPALSLDEVEDMLERMKIDSGYYGS